MKKVLCMFLAMACAVSMIGCGLFSTESTEVSTGDIKLTEAYSFSTPEELKNATRYAYTSGESQEIAEGYKMSYDVDCLSEYVVIYGDKEDNAVAQYDFWVFKTEGDASKFMKQASEYGLGNMVQEGNVVWDCYDSENVQSLIIMQRQYSGLSEGTCSAYARFIKEAYGYMDVQ